MDHFRKTVHNGKNDSIATRGGETSDEIHGQMGPWTGGDRKRSKHACRGVSGS